MHASCYYRNILVAITGALLLLLLLLVMILVLEFIFLFIAHSSCVYVFVRAFGTLVYILAPNGFLFMGVRVFVRVCAVMK